MRLRHLVSFGLLAACNVATSSQSPQQGGAGGVDDDLIVEPSNPNHPGDYDDAPDTGANYQGGPVMNGKTTLYLMFYGGEYEVSTSARRQLFEDFAHGLDGSALANVLTSYSDGGGHKPTGRFDVKWASWTKNLGDHLSQDNLESLILGLGPNPDPNTIYVIIGDQFTTADTPSGDNICDTNAGAWHNYFDDIGARYEFILDPTACNRGVSWSDPNNDPVGDQLVSYMWHETAEAVTDPEPDDDTGWAPEIADMCEGSMQTASSSSLSVGYAQVDSNYSVTLPGGKTASANVHLNYPAGTGRDYLVQPIWQNVQGGGCVRRLALNRPMVASLGHYATGTFDHNDTIGDLLFQNTATGDVYYRSLPSGNASAGPPVDLGTAGTGWMIYGVADFTGGGFSDILWRDQWDGILSIWTNGTSHRISANTDGKFGVRAVGDFDGNGAADILFLDMEDNTTRMWLNDGSMPWIDDIDSLPSTNQHPGNAENADVIGTGDFDGDGKSDILWIVTDQSTGTTIQNYRWWHMNGTTVVGHDATALLGYDHVLGVADMQGFGHATAIAKLNGNIYSVDVNTGAAQLLRAAPPSNWRYAGASMIPGQGPCLFWFDRTTGSVHRWTFDFGGNYLAAQDVLDSPAAFDQLVAY